MTVDKKQFGRNFKRILKEKHLSHLELEKISGISHTSMTNWTSGGYAPRADTIAILCKSLEVSADELLEGIVKE